jgi:hypothetical protein
MGYATSAVGDFEVHLSDAYEVLNSDERDDLMDALYKELLKAVNAHNERVDKVFGK